jgi:Arylsulfotransferase (ASST)
LTRAACLTRFPVLSSTSRRWWALLVLVGSCRGTDLVAPPRTPVPVVAAEISVNPHNTLSALLSVATEHADSARVVFQDQNGGLDSTPYVAVTGGIDTVVTLGLRASTTYQNVIEVKGPTGEMASDTLSFTTGPLPDLLNRVTISTEGTAGPGLTMTSVQVGGNAVFAIAFDSVGTIRWYRQFEEAKRIGGELKQQPNGYFTLYRGASTGSQPVPGHYVEFSPSGDSVRSITVSPPRYLDNHELWITTAPDGGERFHFFTYDHRVRDLTAIGGGAEVSLAGHQLVRLRSDGSTEFEWNAWDQVGIDEWIEPPRPDPAGITLGDFDHPNSLGFDRDGNYIVSFRNTAQVMKIDAETGEVIWRLGGIRNEFTIIGDPLGGFSAQHSARILPNGNLLVYDNGTSHMPPETRAVEYVLDLAAMTATMVWDFRRLPPIYTDAVGLVQRLQNGNTLIGYGRVGHATEVGPDGLPRWEVDLSVDGEPAFVYRFVRIGSLYQYLEP